MVAFIIKNPIDLDLSDEIDQSDEKERIHQIYHRDADYYVVISRNTSVPMIGHLELATGTLTTHASWAWLIKIGPRTQIFLRCVRTDLDLINYEHGAFRSD